MGHQVKAKCLDCGNTFTVDHGGGFLFHLVRCDTCGMTKPINFADLGELHLRYLKGLGTPYCGATWQYDEYVQKEVQVEPISEEHYHRAIEDIAGGCSCGGHYTFNAAPRCPKCRSTRIEEGDVTLMYD